MRKGKPVYRALLKHNISFPAFAQLVLSTAAQNCANLTNCTIDEEIFNFHDIAIKSF